MVSNSSRYLLPLVLALAMPALPAQEAPTNPYVLKTKIREVTVFKNGYGFFLREGQVKLRDGWCHAESVPPAAFGTLLFYSEREGEVVDTVGSGSGEIVVFDGVDAPDDLRTRRGRLEASVGLDVELRWKVQSKLRSAAGRLISVGKLFAILDDGESSFAVPISPLRSLKLRGLSLRIHVSSPKGGSPEGTAMGLGYLRSGITWIPEYTLEVVGEDEARLTLRGTIINQAEDLIHSDLKLVVGAPHFAHQDKMAPLAIGQTLRTLGAAVAPPGLRGQIMNRAGIATNLAMRNFAPNGAPAPSSNATGLGASGLANLPHWDEGAGSDYTVYTRKDMTLRKGEKAIITLFTKTIHFSHSYRWELPQRMKHDLVLHNSSDTSWTTGPCLAMEKGQPLSEDLLRYTPRGSRVRIPVSDAINVAHRRSEAEIERKLKAHSPRRGEYLDLVTIEGELHLKNLEGRKAALHIVVPVKGRPISASDEGRKVLNTDELRLEKRRGRVIWDVEVEAGKSRVLRYRYERYVPSR